MNPNKWNKNVGTASNPVSYLHEYAVALLWEQLDAGLARGREVRARVSPDEFSGDLLAGVKRMSIPDSLTPIGGFIPDIALFGENDKPIRVIEVAVTSAPAQSKIANLAQRGVDVVTIPVGDENDLKRLCWTPAEITFAPDLKSVYARRWSASANIIMQRQRNDNETVRSLISALRSCSPETRREFLDVLRNLDTLDSLYPLSSQNPKRDTLSPNA